jgi:hypothetical protein
VIDEPQFARLWRDIEPNARRRDEVREDLDWALARHPEWGQRTESPNIWARTTEAAYRADGALEVPPLVVYYRFDDENVWLIHVEVDSDAVGDL